MLIRKFALAVLITSLLSVSLGLATAAPGDVKEIAIASGADPVSLDPRKTFVGPGYSINAHVFEPLVFREETNGAIKIVGVLAEKWENVNPTTWKFTLRKNVKFHNGRPLNAQAVQYTIETIMAADFVTSLKQWPKDIVSVTTEGDHVVVMKTKYPTPGLLSSLCQVPIVEPNAAKEMGNDFNIKPVGTGPYKIESYIPNSHVTVSRFDGYWGKKGTYDKITFKIMPVNSVRLAALQSGEVVLAEGIPPDKLDVVNRDPRLYMATSKTMRVVFLNLEMKNKWLSKVEVRQAISYAIDRQLLVDALLCGTTIVANSVSPPGTVGYNDKLPPYEYNLGKAKQLLKESGYDGTVLKFGACAGRYNMDKQVSEAIVGMLRKAGFNIEFEAVDWGTYRPKTIENKYDIWFLGQTDFTLNPTMHYTGKFDTATSDIDYKDPVVDKLLTDSASEMNPEARAAIFSKIQELLHTSMPTVPLYYEPQLIGVSKSLVGFVPRLDEYVLVGYTTVKK